MLGRGPDGVWAREGPWTGAVQEESQLQEEGVTKASCRRTRASWQVAVQKGRQSQGLELASSWFRKWRLALWAMGCGPDPSFGVWALRGGRRKQAAGGHGSHNVTLCFNPFNWKIIALTKTGPKLCGRPLRYTVYTFILHGWHCGWPSVPSGIFQSNLYVASCGLMWLNVA